MSHGYAKGFLDSNFKQVLIKYQIFTKLPQYLPKSLILEYTVNGKRPTACIYPAKKLILVLITLCEVFFFFFPLPKRDDEITCFIPMKYKIFLGKGSIPALWTPRTPIGLLFLLADSPPPPHPEMHWCPWLESTLVTCPYLYCNVLSIRAMNILTL